MGLKPGELKRYTWRKNSKTNRWENLSISTKNEDNVNLKKGIRGIRIMNKCTKFALEDTSR